MQTVLIRLFINIIDSLPSLISFGDAGNCLFNGTTPWNVVHGMVVVAEPLVFVQKKMTLLAKNDVQFVEMEAGVGLHLLKSCPDSPLASFFFFETTLPHLLFHCLSRK